MSLKEFAKERLRDFFLITTFVNIVMFVLGEIYNSDAILTYDAFLYPVLYGFLGTLPAWLAYSKKEPSMKQLIVRHIFVLLVLEILLVLVTFPKEAYSADNIGLFVAFGGSVLIVYLLVLVVTWYLDRKSAVQIMKDLELYQSQYEKENSR